MAEYTGEVIYEKPQVRNKPVVNPALVNALVPPAVAPRAAAMPAPLSPQDQRAFDLAEAKKNLSNNQKLLKKIELHREKYKKKLGKKKQN